MWGSIPLTGHALLFYACISLSLLSEVCRNVQGVFSDFSTLVLWRSWKLFTSAGDIYSVNLLFGFWADLQG